MSVSEIAIMKTILKHAFLLVVLMACGDKEIPNTLPEQCQLEPDPGPCKALIKRYYYDKTEKRCKEFNWGGCDGVVPFETLEECHECERTKGGS